MTKRAAQGSGPSAKRSKRASQTAKRGYSAEAAIVDSINDGDETGVMIARKIFGSVSGTIRAKKGTHGAKSDVLISRSGLGSTATKGIQVKYFKSLPGYNSIGRGTLENYATLFGISKDVKRLLGFFCGEGEPADYDPEIRPRDRKGRRLFLNEFSAADRTKIVQCFSRNPASVIKRVMRGSGGIQPDWLLIIRAIGKLEMQLVSMSEAVELFAAGPVRVSSRGNLEIGGVTMQRKGATRDPRPNDLQFKVKLEPVWEAIRAKART